MHFRFFDDLMGSAPEASTEFRFEQKGNIQKKLLIKLFKNVWKFYIKFAQKFKKFPKKFKTFCKI